MEVITLLGAVAIRHKFGIKDSHIGTIYSYCKSHVFHLRNRVNTRIKYGTGKLYSS